MKGKSLLVVLFVSLLAGPLAGQDDVASSQQSCDAGDMQSCDDLGLRYQGALGVTRDPARALVLFQRACDEGLMLGCTHSGVVLQRDEVGITQDHESAFFLFERACDGGEMLGCANLGVSYERGDGVIQDQAHAVSLYERACGGGEMVGCSNLGSMYRMGRGVAVDLGAAVSLYWRACEGGVTLSCVNLAVSYERGDGVPENVATAVNLYRLACEEGVTLACERIGVTRERAPADRVAATDGFSRAGWVADTDTGQRLSEAIVDIPELGIRVITDESGRVQFPELPTGRHRLFVERVGYQRMEGDLDVPETREFLLPLDRTTISDLGAPGRIVGRVLEGGREFGVADVDITVMTSPPVSTLSDPNGRFSLSDVGTGLVEVRFQRLGYAARTATVIVQPDRTLEIAASMSARPIELDPITVVVRSRALERNGFYRRANASAGTQFSREDLMAINPIFISDLFVRVPGVRMEAGVLVGRQAGFGGTCQIRLFLDGLPMEGWDFDTIPPDYLEAMEIYQGLSVPIQYGPACGVVLFWTRNS